MEELAQLASVPTQIITPKESKPIISVVQDIATGLYRLTKSHVRVSEKQLFNLMATNTKFKGFVPKPQIQDDGVSYWSGRQVLSQIFPERLNIEIKDDQYDESKTDEENKEYVTKIKCGELVSGKISKDVYQARTRGVIHSVYNEYGPDETRQLFDNTQRLICDWLVYNGFSCGVSDLVIDQKTQQEFKEIIHNMKKDVYSKMREIHEGKFENKSTKNNSEYFEIKVNDILNKANGDVGSKGLDKIDENINRLINMIKSKSKGSKINVAQMIGCVGQQNVDGRRIPYGFDDRTLPHYPKYDDGPESRGFVENSFVKGLTPQEFFFHAMGGREGLIDTAVQTSETGYIQRKLVKAMEDCKVSFDMSVRNASGVLIQFLYGEDGMDACKLESQQIPTIDMELEKIQAIYGLVATGIEDFKDVLTKGVYDELNGNASRKKKFIQRMKEHHQQVLEDREHLIMKVFGGKKETTVTYPVSFYRIINNMQQMNIKYGANVSLDLSPDYVLDVLDKLCTDLVVTKRYPGNRIFQTLLRAYLSPKRAIMMYKLSKASFDAIVDQIKFRFYESLAHPSDMVGVVAAQSIGEPATQLVLNSVAYDTELLLNFDGKFKRVKIGEYIDAQMERDLKIEEHPNDTKLAWLDEKVTILSCDENGKVSWKRVEAVTRHPVVNKDGTNTVLEVTTKSGRKIIATKGKSFLKRVDNKIVPVNGDELHVGDHLPVSTILPVEADIMVTELDLSEYLPKTEYIYMSEINKGIELAKKFDNNKRYGYWQKHHGVDFTTPYNRSDSFYARWMTGKRGGFVKLQDNCVYPSIYGAVGNGVQTNIPEKIQLDTEFGFFVGAYLAEGMTCSSGDKSNAEKKEHHVLISNVDPKFNLRITQFVDALGARYHWDDREINGGRSVTIRIHSSILAELMSKMCGNGSANKRIPAWALQAPDVFLKGLIDGYFSGDGSMDKRSNYITAYSVSHGLLEDIQQILIRYNIQSMIKFLDMTNMRNKRPNAVIQDGYKIAISMHNAICFARTFTSTIDYKEKELERMRNSSFNDSILHQHDIIPSVKLSDNTEIRLTRKQVAKMIESTKNEKDQIILSSILEETIMYDEIKFIKEIPNPTQFVYDLSVEDTKNFNGYNSICYRDTFHSAGISSASKAVRGVPRLNELLAVSKSIKTPIMKIHLNETVNQDAKKCIEIMNNIRTIRFKDIVSSSKIYFDPSDLNTSIEEDRAFIELYNAFVNEAGNDTRDCPWLLRLEFDRTKMLDYKLDMITLHNVLTNFYESTISCIFPDDNASQLIMRIKIAKDKESGLQSDDLLTELKALEHNILENVVIKGIKNIERVAIDEQITTRYEPALKTFNTVNEWVVYTAGTNLRDVLANPVVDAPRTITNDVNEIYEYLGIEAARQALYNEIIDVMDSITINYRHVALLVDVMTNRGTILSVNRHGINRGDIGPLAKCSFEETTDKLIKAGIFAEHDKINGVSANVMLGQIAPCGTGDVDIMMDEIILSQMPDIKEEEEEDLDEEETDQNKACLPEVLKTNMNVTLNKANVTRMRKEDNDFVFM